MIRWKHALFAAVAAAALIAGPSLLRAEAPAAPAAVPAPENPVAKRDPAALTALVAMGNYLKTVKTFELHTKTSLERTVDDSDMKLTFAFEGTYKVRRPDGFYIETRSDRQIRQFYYDGKTFTVNVPRQKFFATVSAPPTIADVVDDIYQQYGIVLPLADVFYWAERGAPTDGISSAITVGYAKIGGTDTDQYFYRGEDLDVQLWIARGGKPLPRKIVITTRSDPAKPSYSAELDWTTGVTFDASTFAFKADSGASPIALAHIDHEEQ